MLWPALTGRRSIQMLSEADFEYLERHWKTVPIPALASRFGISPLDLTAALREKGIVTEIQPLEIQFINENLDRIPAKEIRERLCLTQTQFSQICQKTLERRTRKAGEHLSLQEAIRKTRWLVEDKLRLPLNDFLPREISKSAFTDNGLHNCIRFAEHAKKGDGYYQYFTAVAFLICKSYPGKYKPFQFRHAKNNEYFKGKGGKKNLLNAVRWVVEKKLEIDSSQVHVVAQNKYFLRSADLQFYGVGPHWYRVHFHSKKELIAEILKLYNGFQSEGPGATSRRLREVLQSAGRIVDQCEVPGCYYDDEYGLDVHHIVPRARRQEVDFDIDAPENLVALCPNHHRVAQTFDWRELNLKSPNDWRGEMIAFIESAERRSESGS